MAKFFKYLLATFLGGLLASIFGILLIVVIVSSMVAMGEKEVTVKDNSVLLLNLNAPIVERLTPNPFQEALDAMNEQPSTLGLNQILANIKKAKRDDRIKGILLDVGMLSTGYATIEEIRNELLRFKESGKFIYAYGSVYTQKAYYLASVANKIYLTPGGMVEFGGIHAQNVYFQGLLEKLGIEMQIFKVGKYKSAVEPFIAKEMSDEARLQTQVYINSIWKHVLTGIATERNLNVEALNSFADKMPLFLDPSEMVKNGLIDSLIYRDELLSQLKELTNVAQENDLNSISHKNYVQAYVEKESEGLVRDKIAVIYAVGGIDTGGSEDIKSEELARTIRKARRDSTIKAIVLRINSPGGSALGSEIIWREVKLAKESKPVVVSMGDLAASGGYYIACAADSIVAHANTLTGSIGIFGMIPNTSELINKVGLSFDGVQTNKFSDMPALTRAFRPEEKLIMQAYVERGYQLFTQRCAEGRGTTAMFIDSVGQGRVWAGETATKIQLVDKIGGLQDAIAIAKRMAKLDSYRITNLPEEKDPFEALFGNIGGDVKAWAVKSFAGDAANYIHSIEALQGAYPLQTRLPYDIEVR